MLDLEELASREGGALAPGLRDYFREPPAGSIGIGEGVYERVGTPRRWLWPALAVAGVLRIAWPRWEQNVPFTVINRSVDHGRVAEREFRFRSGPRVMLDRIEPAPAPGTGTVSAGTVVVDRLGRGGILTARLRATVIGGALRLRSERVRLLGIPIPMRVDLLETALEGGEQRVDLRVSAPGIGTVYEYAGRFRYRVEAAG